MIKALAHACFTASDLDTSIAFYVDKLGLQHAFDFTNDEGKRFGVYLHIGGRNFIELFEGDVGDPKAKTPYRHICLEVEDVQAAVEDLRAKGVEITDAKLGSDGSWQAWLSDPDGNRIELHGYTPDSAQRPWLE